VPKFGGKKSCVSFCGSHGFIPFPFLVLNKKTFVPQLPFYYNPRTKESLMQKIHYPSVSGLFYPSDPHDLKRAIEGYLLPCRISRSLPKAIIVPHAGYIYSGPIAGSAYGLIQQGKGIIHRVVLMGTAHRLGFSGLAAPTCQTFMTPLGPVPIDLPSIQQISQFSQFQFLDEAHEQEHSLEVHLPFLQTVLDQFKIIPLVVGNCFPDEVADVLDALWGKEETLIVVSSDLSHYLDGESAKRMDAETSQAIEVLQLEKIETEQACGAYPVRGLLVAAKRHGMIAKALDVRNSGETAGPQDRVVGYGAFGFWEV
jgi:hypothetical protein